MDQKENHNLAPLYKLYGFDQGLKIVSVLPALQWEKQKMEEYKHVMTCHVLSTLQKNIYDCMSSMGHFSARSQQSLTQYVSLLKLRGLCIEDHVRLRTCAVSETGGVMI